MSGIFTTLDSSPLVQSKATTTAPSPRLTREQCAALADTLEAVVAVPGLLEGVAANGIEPLHIQEAHRYLLQLAQR